MLHDPVKNASHYDEVRRVYALAVGKKELGNENYDKLRAWEPPELREKVQMLAHLEARQKEVDVMLQPHLEKKQMLARDLVSLEQSHQKIQTQLQEIEREINAITSPDKEKIARLAYDLLGQKVSNA